MIRIHRYLETKLSLVDSELADCVLRKRKGASKIHVSPITKKQTSRWTEEKILDKTIHVDLLNHNFNKSNIHIVSTTNGKCFRFKWS